MKRTVTLYCGSVKHNNWTFRIAASDYGLCRVLQPDQSLHVLEKWMAKHFPSAELIPDDHRILPYSAQFEEFFSGSRKNFDFPLDLHGTDFQVSVWRAVLQIPYGATKNYSQISAEIDRPKAVRAVGAANGANPIPIAVPCHRVIGKSGLLTGYRGGLEVKEQLLALEGVTGMRR